MKKISVPLPKMIVVCVLVASLILGAAYMFVVSPASSTKAANKDELELATQAAAAASGQVAQLKQNADMVGDATADIEELTSRFPTDFEQEVWLLLLSDAAKEAGVTIKTLVPSLPADPSTIVDGQGGAAVAPPTSTLPGTPAAPGTAVPGAVPGAPAPGVTTPGTTPPATGTDPAAAAAVPVASPLAVSVVSMEVQGSRDSMVRFMQILEQLERPLILTNVQIAGSGDSVTGTITGRTYLSRPVEIPPMPEAE